MVLLKTEATRKAYTVVKFCSVRGELNVQNHLTVPFLWVQTTGAWVAKRLGQIAFPPDSFSLEKIVSANPMISQRPKNKKHTLIL